MLESKEFTSFKRDEPLPNIRMKIMVATAPNAIPITTPIKFIIIALLYAQCKKRLPFALKMQESIAWNVIYETILGNDKKADLFILLVFGLVSTALHKSSIT
jgi:hypothetical protein